MHQGLIRRLAALLGVALLALLTVPVASVSASSPGTERRAPKEPTGAPGTSRVADKLAELTADGSLAGVARRNHLSIAKLTKLAQDRNAWLDGDDQVFFVEPVAPAGSPEVAAAAPYPYADTFTLHSRPGAQRTIYLDFDGETVSGTAWNTANGTPSVQVEPYDSDGNPGTFSNAEQDEIQSVWQRVAEDYGAVDVDVTTQDPGAAAITRTDSADQVYGTRVLITPTSFIYSSCSCGGKAYLGVFDRSGSHATYQPAWVFTQGVGTGAKNIAEAASHEVGHNLGLSHDGTASVGYYQGHGHWAPIMGVGYYQPLSQFSQGEYAGANNTEDDYAVMASHGAAVVADDHGDTQPTATAITPGQPVTATISGPGDVDYFVYSGDNAASFTVKPSAVSPNLDVEVTRVMGTDTATYAAANQRVDKDIATGLDASFPVPADNSSNSVYIAVQGSGEGDPQTTGESNYGSRGKYTLSFTTQAAGPSWKAWGAGTSGELGNGGTADALSPANVVAGDFKQIAPSTEATYGLKADGTVWAWGSNETFCSLAQTPCTGGSVTPVQVPGLSNISKIGAGHYNGFAITQSGEVYGWGYNFLGALGVGSDEDAVATPTKIPGLTGVTSVAGGVYATHALKSDGTVWSWGRNEYGNLGDGTWQWYVTTPVKVVDLTGVAQVAVGEFGTIALKSDGSVWRWGQSNGQISVRPVPIQGIGGVAEIANELVLKNDGTVWALGGVTSTLVGDGTPSAHWAETPVRVGGLSGVTHVAASWGSYGGAYALKGDGTLWAWGANHRGQLGNGTTVDSTAPVQVPVSGVDDVVASLGNAFAIG